MRMRHRDDREREVVVNLPAIAEPPHPRDLQMASELADIIPVFLGGIGATPQAAYIALCDVIASMELAAEANGGLSGFRERESPAGVIVQPGPLEVN